MKYINFDCLDCDILKSFFMSFDVLIKSFHKIKKVKVCTGVTRYPHVKYYDYSTHTPFNLASQTHEITETIMP